MIGHKGHPEVEGTMGQLSDGHLPGRGRRRRRAAARSRSPSRLAVVTQTTLVGRRRGRDPRRGEAALPERARAQAAGHLLRDAEPPGRGQGAGAARSTCVIVVGSPTSSNSNRLRELAQRLGTPAYMVDQPDDLRARVVRRPAPRRPDRRRLGARHPGAAGDRAAARARRGVGAQRPGRRGDGALPAAEGAGRQVDGAAGAGSSRVEPGRQWQPAPWRTVFPAPAIRRRMAAAAAARFRGGRRAAAAPRRSPAAAGSRASTSGRARAAPPAGISVQTAYSEQAATISAVTMDWFMPSASEPDGRVVGDERRRCRRARTGRPPSAPGSATNWFRA